ncbi:MAG: DUF1211 domain-containing protein [Acidobacteria bacterium]|nr:DUF1211 domain-containing protein [Acidobacteriota bacterium]
MPGDERSGLTTQRVEAFSDGVFAIAITLLILEVRVPEDLHGEGRLGQALARLWPSYVAYILSFVMIGIYWANHHYIFQFFRRTDHMFNLLNVLFLMCISFLPFPTAVLGKYAAEPLNRQAAVSLYNLGLLLPAAAWLLFWLYARGQARILDPHLDPAFVGRLTRQFLLSNALYASALVVSFWSAGTALAVCVSLTLLYLLPPRKPVYRAT